MVLYVVLLQHLDMGYRIIYTCNSVLVMVGLCNELDVGVHTQCWGHHRVVIVLDIVVYIRYLMVWFRITLKYIQWNGKCRIRSDRRT